MPAPVLTFRDEFDVVRGSTFHDFGQVVPGSPTSTEVFNLWNGFGLTGGSAVDTAKNIALIVEGRITATGGQWLGEGIGLLESLALQVQLPNVPRYAGFTAVGTGITIRPGDLETDSKQEMNVRVVLPAGAQEVGIQFKIGVDLVRTIALPGDALAHEPGISRGVGRGIGTFALERSGAFTVSGTGAGSTLRWPDYSWYLLGRPYQDLGGALSGDEVLSNLDGSSVALGAGESYLFLTTLDNPDRLIVKGDLVTGTAVFPADAPPIPEDIVLTGHGIRFADADALAPQHTELVDAEPQGFNVLTSGLNYTVRPPGVAAIVSNRLNDNVTDNTGSFPGDGTHTVWVLPDGSVDDTVGPDGPFPFVGSLRLFDIEISGSVEISRVDYRRWRDKFLTVEFRFDGPGTGQTTEAWKNPLTSRLLIRPESVELELDIVPGADVFADVLIRPDNGAAVTIFTSFASDDRRPRLQSGDSTAIDKGLPEVLIINPGDTVGTVLDVAASANISFAILSFIADIE